MRYIVAAALAAALAWTLGSGPERSVSPAGAPAAVARVAPELPKAEAVAAVHVAPPPRAPDRFTATALPSVEQPVSPGWGYVVDAAALGWIPRSFLLKEGDAILEINGEPVTSSAQVVEAVRGTAEGSAVQLRVRFLRNGDTSTFWASN
jgi:S1-C subfamily serine protease